jgi:hypothetical protein
LAKIETSTDRIIRGTAHRSVEILLVHLLACLARPRRKPICLRMLVGGGLLLLGGCSGGDYEERFKKSMDTLKATGQPIPHSGQQAPAASDQPTAAAQPPAN